MSVDVRNWMAARIGGTLQDKGHMLCANGTNFCLTSTNDGDPYGEVKIMYDKTNGIVDYVAITSFNHQVQKGDTPYYIGVIRNFSGNGGKLRCFSNYYSGPELCRAPSDSFMIPEGVPYQMNVPVVSYATVQAASNSDGSPKYPIPGAKGVTGGGSRTYWPFEVMDMTGSCVQSPAYGGPSETNVLIAYVPDVPFDGSTKYGIGTRDALVIDTFGLGPPKNAERYYYAWGLGRVEEGTSTYDTGDGYYDLNKHNIVHNDLRPLDTSIITDFNQSAQCGQGSYIPLWVSGLHKR